MSAPAEFEQRTALFAAALGELYAELDWPLLGQLHCHEGGDDFFSEEAQEALQDAALLFAADVAAAVEELPGERRGRSIYLGASIFELAPMLLEKLVLGRKVFAITLPGPEATEISRALQVVADNLNVDLPRLRTEAFAPGNFGSCDHLWMVSVLTDPDSFPALHDELYERHGTDLATRRGHMPRETREAQFLIKDLLQCAKPPCLITTSDEERPFFERALEGTGLTLEVPNAARLSGIVGDRVRHCRLLR